MIKVPRDITYPHKIKQKSGKKKTEKEKRSTNKKKVCSAKGEVFGYEQ